MTRRRGDPWRTALSATLEELQQVEQFDPPEGFREHALVRDRSLHEQAASDPEAWWAEQAEALHWFEKWDTVLDEDDPPFYKWFEGGKINASYNCLDRHVEAGKRRPASRSTGAARRARSATSRTPTCSATSRSSPTR